MDSKVMITHSLLSSWQYAMKENPFEDAENFKDPMEDFMRVLNRVPTEQTDAMKNGCDFEDLVTSILNGTYREPEPYEQNGEVVYPVNPWYEGASKVASIVDTKLLQVKAYRTEEINGMNIFLYGRLDALRAGHIFDIKFSKGYDRGKYYDSTQHPMYFAIVPDAKDFTYVVSNGTDVWTEQYFKDDVHPIEDTVSDFIDWLNVMGLMETFKEKWRTM